MYGEREMLAREELTQSFTYMEHWERKGIDNCG